LVDGGTRGSRRRLNANKFTFFERFMRQREGQKYQITHVVRFRQKIDVDTDSGRENENPVVKTCFYSCIKLFLYLSVVLLVFEIVMYFEGWYFGMARFQLKHLLWASSFGVKGFFDWLYARWFSFKWRVSRSSSTVLNQCVHRALPYPKYGYACSLFGVFLDPV